MEEPREPHPESWWAEFPAASERFDAAYLVEGLGELLIPQGTRDFSAQLLRVLSVSGLFIAVALTYTGGLQGTGDTRSPLYISIVSQVAVPLGICFVVQRVATLDALDIWIAILVGHATRCALSVLRFNQGKWRQIAVE